MVYTCSVPGCRGNYDKENKVHVFSFPSDVDLKEKWLRAIPREDFIITKNSKVCERHFKDGEVLFRTTFYVEKTGETLSAPLKKPKLKEKVIPSIFPGCPPYLSSSSTLRESPTKKRQRIENDQVALALAESIKSKNDFDQKNSFEDFGELQRCLREHIISEHWTFFVKNQTLLFIFVNLKNDIPELQYAVSINSDLKLNVSFRGEKLLKHKNDILPLKVSKMSEILDILDFYEENKLMNLADPLNEKINVIESVFKNSEDLFNDKNKFFFEFFLEQINLVKCKPERYRYSPDILIFASLLFYISPQAYKFIRSSQYMILPGPSTIRKIGAMLKNSPQDEGNNFLAYAKQAFLKLKDNDYDVFLMIDEIHIKPFLDYKGGNIVGTAYNNANLATSVHVFMLESQFSLYKDVVHIVPVQSFDASKLYDLLNKVIMGLEDIGYKVNGIVTDNNSINRKAVSYFANPPQLLVRYVHPKDDFRPLFFVIDSVHIYKCFRNNWMNNHKNGYYFYFPSFAPSDESDPPEIMTASLSSVRKLYDLECTKILKFGYGLTRKALWPSNLERQNVKLAQKLFSSNVVDALRELGSKHHLEHYDQTAEFINLICTWWDIVNVKTPNKGKVKRNPMCEPITSSPSDEKLIFLKQFASWLTRWENFDSNNGRLSKETFLAARHTTEVFIEITHYFTKEFKKSYVLLGKLQTDKLESRFGQYRSMAGDQYHISVRQIYETESKLRLCHDLKLASHSKGAINVDIFDRKDDNVTLNREEPVDLIFFDITVEESDIKEINDSLSIITYLAGYCSYAALKRTNCSDCRQMLIVEKEAAPQSYFNLIEVKDRGGLLFPSEVVINAVIHTYIVVQKLISEKYENTFIKVSNQRNLVINLVEDILVTKDSFLCFDACVTGHDLLPLIKIILKSATNSLLNNYCKGKNDNLKVKKIPNITVVAKNKRKLETYSKNSVKKTQDDSKA